MAKLKAAENWPVRDASPCPQVRPSRKDSLVPADPGPEAGDDDDGNLAEPWTVAQAQEARADAGCTDLEAALAAVARCDLHYSKPKGEPVSEERYQLARSRDTPRANNRTLRTFIEHRTQLIIHE